jgi:hypothetical protein
MSASRRRTFLLAFAAIAALSSAPGPRAIAAQRDSESRPNLERPATARAAAGQHRRSGPAADPSDRRLPREPAAARGYGDGYDKGLNDGRGRDRYDPVRHRDYRRGNGGYDPDYGSMDAYTNNYRAGFRQGYEDGYRDGARR